MMLPQYDLQLVFGHMRSTFIVTQFVSAHPLRGLDRSSAFPFSHNLADEKKITNPNESIRETLGDLYQNSTFQTSS